MKPFVRATIALVIALLIPSFARGLTEAEAIGLFLEESPQVKAVPLEKASVDAELRAEGLVPNPSIAYEIEDTTSARDEFLTVEQELPVTGRRGLLRRRARAAAEAAGLVAERELQRDAYELKLAFHEVLFREERLEKLSGGVVSLERTVAILREREKEGESSGYDLLRAEQELSALQIERTEAESALAAARSRFGSFFDSSMNMKDATLSGDLAATAPVAEDAVELALKLRPDLRALSAQAERMDLEHRAARRERLPQPTLTAGWKRTEALELSENGFVAGLSVSLPVFNRGQSSAARAAADRQLVELEREILEREIRAEVGAAQARERAARERSQLHGPEVERRAGELRRIAQLAYDEGESGILELLDAHRTSLSMDLQALEARYEAKIATIELDRVIGIEVQP